MARNGLAMSAVAKSARKQREIKRREDPPKKKAPPPCQQCRAKHAACDRTRPTCQRCADKSQECTWDDEDARHKTIAQDSHITVDRPSNDNYASIFVLSSSPIYRGSPDAQKSLSEHGNNTSPVFPSSPPVYLSRPEAPVFLSDHAKTTSPSLPLPHEDHCTEAEAVMDLCNQTILPSCNSQESDVDADNPIGLYYQNRRTGRRVSIMPPERRRAAGRRFVFGH